MKQAIKQADIARELGVTDMTIHRFRKAMFIDGTAITDRHATMILAAFELQRVGITPSRSSELVSRFHSEIQYASGGQDRRAWLVFVEDDRHDIVLPALTGRHLESILAAHPLSIVLPLHETVTRAVKRLQAMRARLAGRAAA